MVTDVSAIGRGNESLVLYINWPPGVALGPKLCFVYFFALQISRKDGATIAGKSVYFSSPTNATLKSMPPTWEKAHDQGYTI